MKIDDACDLLTRNGRIETAPVLPGELTIFQVEAEDTLEVVLAVRGQQTRPVVLILPESGTLFSSPEHLFQLRQIRAPEETSLVIPRSRVGIVAKMAYQQGFAFTSSLAKAIVDFRKGHPVANPQQIHQSNDLSRLNDDDDQTALHPTSVNVKSTSAIDVPTSSILLLERQDSQTSPPLPVAELVWGKRKALSRVRLTLVVTVALLLLAAALVLLPFLFAAPPPTFAFMATPSQATPIGGMSFTSSGQLNPNSSQGLNDILTVDFQHLTPPAPGKALYAWLLPDQTNDEVKPIRLGTLHSGAGGSAQFTYDTPDHRNLLADYSRFLVTEEPAGHASAMSVLDTKTWRYQGEIPSTPTPGDASSFSHLRDLLAKDPVLDQIGIAGGLDTQLDRNSQRILEASSAARDDWTSHNDTLIREQIDRIVDYLDGETYAWRDLPHATPFLIDPKAGRIGLLTNDPHQNPPGYLKEIIIHLSGLVNAPGSTTAQKQLAMQVERTMNQVNAVMFNIRGDAVVLAKMNDHDLQQEKALSLLDDINTNANRAYVGQFDPATGKTQEGIVRIVWRLQKLANTPIYATSLV